MVTYKVRVKWGKEVFPDVELDVSEPVEVFKAQVFALTSVEPRRQKLMIKGSTLKTDSWDGVKVKDGIMVYMMGSREENMPVEPTEKPVFIEDMTEAEVNSMLDMPVGIKNLGNTCYMNAVVQCLKTVPELDKSIQEYKPSGGVSSALTSAVRDLYKTMDSGKTSVPIILVNLLRTTFPKFSEQSEQGTYLQQDASECWKELTRMFQDTIPALDPEMTNESFRQSLIDQYFSGEFLCEWKCTESEEEAVGRTTEKFTELFCHISQDVKYVQSGLVLRLKEQISKRSPTLDRDAIYEKTCYVTRLPAYLTVVMVRFFYKEKKEISAKILKDIKFPLVLDVFDLCSKDLKDKLMPAREKYKAMDDRLFEEGRLKHKGKTLNIEENKNVTLLPTSFGDDKGSNHSGIYELQAVLTHQGRSSSSGHYIAWVRFKDNNWLKCDDDDVTAVTEEEILRLSGGGDWHCAYILLYGPHPLQVFSPKEGEEKAVSTEETKTKTN